MVDFHLDASGLRCPMPLLKVKLQLNSMRPGQELEVRASDPGSARDIPAWLEHTRHRLVEQGEKDGSFFFLICAGPPESG